MKEKAVQLLKQLEEDIKANRLALPSLPETAIKVRQLTSDAQCSFVELEQEIAKDAGITARLIKVANSSALLRSRKVTTLKQALSCLGISLIRSLVTQLVILQSLQTGTDKATLREFVENSIAVSSLCHSLASGHRHLDAEQAALAGLLHDVGRLPLQEFLAKRVELTARERVKLEQMMHPVVGALLLNEWRMPEEVIVVARFHENIMRETQQPGPDYVDITIAANLLHYGLEHPRYQRYKDEVIPALSKSMQDEDADHEREKAQSRASLFSAG
ncbi:conserved hypothetical protein [gamma proteobacterium HdN1]|nr:conserved hypothetical protein [gamma proteobacterium HdN1]